MFLTDNTLKIYRAISSYEYLNNFTFVGGSAIAYYLNHRLSEDLDFFTWLDKLPYETTNFVNTLSKNHQVIIANASNTYMDILVDDVKISFFANNWGYLKSEREKIDENIHIAKLELLSAMKCNALSLRAKYRDYYDLYVINKERYDIYQLLEFALKFIPGMTRKVFCMQLTYIDDIEDENIEHLSPRIKISLKQIQKHFENEVKKLLEKWE
jgi:predicted nucleotidyltransferase component of viral defense system